MPIINVNLQWADDRNYTQDYMDAPFYLSLNAERDFVFSKQCTFDVIGTETSCNAPPVLAKNSFDPTNLIPISTQKEKIYVSGYTLEGVKFAQLLCSQGDKCRFIDLFVAHNVTTDNYLYNQTA